MKNVSTKSRGVRALIMTGVAGAGLLMSGFSGTVAESRPLGTIIDPCEEQVLRAINCYPPTTRNNIPENQTSSTTTTEATTTTQGQQPTTSTTEGQQPTTTAGPGSTTSTSAPRGVAGAGAARPIAAQASYTG